MAYTFYLYTLYLILWRILSTCILSKSLCLPTYRLQVGIFMGVIFRRSLFIFVRFFLDIYGSDFSYVCYHMYESLLSVYNRSLFIFIRLFPDVFPSFFVCMPLYIESIRHKISLYVVITQWLCETYKYEKRPTNMERDLLKTYKRDSYIWWHTFFDKRRINTKNETHKYKQDLQKRPIYTSHF